MKSIHKMALAAVLALSSAGLASATVTVIHVTGSTAYRGSDVTAECAYLGAGTTAVTFGNVSTGTSTGNALTSANYSIVYGPVSGGNQTVFENFFNGSIAGDEALVVPVALKFPLYSAYSSAAGAVTQGSSTANAVITTPSSTNEAANYAGNFDTAAPDFAFSDVAYSTANQIIALSSDANSNTAAGPAGSATVGIVPFVFVCNGSTDVTSELSGLSMDPQKFTYVWESGGTTPFSYFTGKNADEATTVYPMGRDVDSGTRATALAETGYGLNGSGIITTPVQQFYPFDNATDDTNDQNAANADPTGAVGFNATTGVIGVAATGTQIGLVDTVPQESVDGYFMGSADGGYYSGGNLAIGISTQFVSGTTNTVLMAYLGASDATNALSGGKSGTTAQAATLMAYNGVKWYPNPITSGTYADGSTPGATGTNAAKIYEGQYTFWSYEHLYYKSSASTIATAVGALVSGGIDQLSSNNVTFGNMKVHRGGDGQNVQ